MEYKVSPFLTVTHPDADFFIEFDTCGDPTFRSETGAIWFLPLQERTSANKQI